MNTEAIIVENITRGYGGPPVLQGLDFRRYAPDLITVEALSETAQAGLTRFLEPLGYRLTDSVRLTLFFKKCTAENSTGARLA